MAGPLLQEHINDQVPLTGAAKLRSYLQDSDDLVVCPGVYDGFTARLALRAGFKCLYMVSSQESHISSFCIYGLS